MPNPPPDLSTGAGWYWSIKQLPDAYGRSRRPRTSGPTSGRTPGNPAAPHISQVGAEQLAARIGLADKEARQYLAELLRIRALNAQAELQILTKSTYSKGTGRFSRGIRVISKVTDSGTQLHGYIRLSLPRYRETKFLTNLGGGGQFFKLGLDDSIKPYQIIAKGALRMFGRSSYKSTPIFVEPSKTYIRGSGHHKERMVNDAVTGKKAISYRQMEKRAVSYAEQYKGTTKVPRLKIPRGGYTTGIRRGGLFTLLREMEPTEVDALNVGRRRRESPIGKNSRGLIPDWDYNPGKRDNSQYRYPIWVIHPGFESDIIANYWQRTIYALMEEMPQLAVKYVEAVREGGEYIDVTSGTIETARRTSTTKSVDPTEFHTYIRSLTNPTSYAPATTAGDWNSRFGRRYGYTMKP